VRGDLGQLSVIPLFRYAGRVPRVKTTVYIEERLRRAAKQAAARSGRHEYEVFESALKEYLGWDILDDLWARNNDLSEDEAMKLAYDELHAHRAEQQADQEAAGGSRG
jgi:hypothetical protein